MRIELTAEEMNYAAELGRLRVEENKHNSHIADYDDRRFSLTTLQNNRLAVMTEIGIGKALGLNMMKVPTNVWAGFVKQADYKKYLGVPDLAGIVECRRADNVNSPLPLRRKDVEAGAIVVQGYVLYKQQGNVITVNAAVTLLGWSDARIDWPNGTTPPWSYGSSRTVERRSMQTFNYDILSEAA